MKISGCKQSVMSIENCAFLEVVEHVAREALLYFSLKDERDERRPLMLISKTLKKYSVMLLALDIYGD